MSVVTLFRKLCVLMLSVSMASVIVPNVLAPSKRDGIYRGISISINTVSMMLTRKNEENHSSKRPLACTIKLLSVSQ